MIYVPIKQPSSDGYYRDQPRFFEYATWCTEYAGKEDIDWQWRRGDQYGKGIYFKDEQVAIMFKLKFAV